MLWLFYSLSSKLSFNAVAVILTSTRCSISVHTSFLTRAYCNFRQFRSHTGL